MDKYYKLIDAGTIAPAPAPLRINGGDIITTDERVYNENGYYKLEREPFPDDEENGYSPYYELNENIIIQKWEQTA